MTKDLLGKLFGDRGYVLQALFEELFERGLTFISKRKKTMKNTLVKLRDKILLRKHAIIESVDDQLRTSVRLSILDIAVASTF
ncbi:transposase [cf. Phormidesmis sp. LEGE 11477]|uniref:transposase n=1 Tax=cf. Phormidesmis sp. LEGE 11477 TaxID=1828680 RepID=UPI0021076915|nr:transposase [cf. Phormidesmis sp. LEGE 11477]